MVKLSSVSVRLTLLEEYNRLEPILLVLKDHVAINVESALSPKHPSKLISRIDIGDSLAICELDIVGPLISHD